MAKSPTNTKDPKTTSIEGLARTREQILSTYPLDAQSILLDNLYTPESKLISLAAEKGFNIKKFLDDRDTLVDLVKKQIEENQPLSEEKKDEKGDHDHDQHSQHQHAPEEESGHTDKAESPPEPVNQATELENQLRTGEAELNEMYHTKGTRDLDKIRAKEEELKKIEKERKALIESKTKPTGPLGPASTRAEQIRQNFPSNNREGLTSRIPQARLNPLTRFNDGLNRGIKAGRALRRAGSQMVGKATSAVGKTITKLGLRALFATPAGWIILLIIGIVALALIIVLFFTNGGTPPPSPIKCESVPGASCVTPGTSCPTVDGKQLITDTSGTYTCSADVSGNPQTCCVPPTAPGYFLPPFECGESYWGWTYSGHSPYAVDWNQYSNADDRDPVRAEANGYVYALNPDYGLVILNYEGGYSARFAHLVLPFEVSKGQRVVTGQIIGHIDNTDITGKSTGSHLHLQHTLRGVAIQIIFYGNQPYINSLNPSRGTLPGPYVTGPCP